MFGISIDQGSDNVLVHKEPRYLPARGSPIRQKKRNHGACLSAGEKFDQRGETFIIQSLLATAVGPHRLESTGTGSKLKSPAEGNQLRGLVVQDMVRYLSAIYQRNSPNQYSTLNTLNYITNSI